jgi:hypothetical protein
MKTKILIMLACLASMLLVIALPVLAEMDHSTMGHDMSATPPTKTVANPQTTSSLLKLQMVPLSGKAREGGFDGRYVMESIDTADVLQVRCAKASRGLMMLDNTEWVRCGGKTVGVPETVDSVKTSRPADEMKGHAGHNM